MASLFVSAKGAGLRNASSMASSCAVTLPGFLIPAWQTHATRQRKFSTTTPQLSKLGRTPLSIPPDVEVSMSEPIVTKNMTSYLPNIKKTITVKGPLGQLEMSVPEFVKIEQDPENRRLALSVANSDITEQKEMWGTSWSYLNNYITGVSEGHTVIIRLVGVGYRATVERRAGKETFPGQDFLCLKLGFTHPVEEGIPAGVKVTTPQPTRILLEGMDKEVLMSFAGRVRKWRPPEPYKGKGVFINDQTIKLKQKKIK